MRMKRRYVPLVDLLIGAAIWLVAGAAALAGLWLGAQLRAMVR